MYFDRLAKINDLARQIFTFKKKLMATGIMKTNLYLSYDGEVTKKDDTFFQKRSLDLRLEEINSTESIIQALK